MCPLFEPLSDEEVDVALFGVAQISADTAKLHAALHPEQVTHLPVDTAAVATARAD